MEVRQYLTENEHLLRKHSRMISAVNKALKENANYGRELDEFKKSNLAVMLENVSHAFDVRAKLTEAQGTQVGDIAKKNDYLNLISAVMPTLVAEDLVNVQPLKQKAGVVYYLKNVFDDNKGAIRKGDVISSFERVYVEDSKLESAFNYTSEKVDSEELVVEDGKAKLAWVPVVPGSVRIGTDVDDGAGHIGSATIDYETGIISGLAGNAEVSYEQDLYQAPIRVPRVKTIVTDITVTARPRKLATAFSLDAAYDLQMTQNVDLQNIIAGAATDEIRSEIDGEILNDLANSGTSMTISWNQPVPFGISKFEHYESFYQTIVEGANKIYAKTRRITGNFVIVGENAANVLETHSKFKAAASLNEAGPHVAGTLNGKYLIVKNPYFDPDQFVIGYNGDTPWDGGYVYAPYMAITSTQFIMGENFLGTQGYATSYAKKLLSGDFYVNGSITHITE